MIGVSASNTKLRDRKVRILREASGEPAGACEAALTAAEGDLRLAMVMLLGRASADAAREALRAVTSDDGHGSVRAALSLLLRFRKEMPRRYLNPQHLYMIIGG
jgi:N-acetylmuramic acid 6-phosphate etherase